MNTVTLRKPKDKYVWTGKVGDLIEDNFKNVKSAFFGNVGLEDTQLFLVTYVCICKADSPSQTWSISTCRVRVIRFVDVNIIVTGDSDE